MKNGLLIILLLLLNLAYGQTLIESRTASLIDGDYSLDGTVFLELYDDNSLNLRFDGNYLTQSNVFDVHVFLTNNTNYTTPIDITGMLLVENIGTVSGLNYSSGPMTFNLPAGVGINDYDNIVFVCIQFGQLHWGNGVFEASIPVGINDIKAIEELMVEVYPNPSESDWVEIKFNDLQQNTLIEVLDLKGHLIKNDRILGKQTYSLELKESGAYFLRISSEGFSTVKKVIRL